MLNQNPFMGDVFWIGKKDSLEQEERTKGVYYRRTQRDLQERGWDEVGQDDVVGTWSIDEAAHMT